MGVNQWSNLNWCVRSMRNYLNFKLRDMELALNCILKQMADALTQGERIEIRGFGSFDLRQRPPRIARNPKTGAAVILSTKVVVHFKPGKEMRDRINAARTKCKILE
jgi:integration host factor subunit beta